MAALGSGGFTRALRKLDFLQYWACTGASKERQTRANPTMSCSIKRKPLHRLVKIDTGDMLITAKCASFKWFADIILYEIP